MKFTFIMPYFIRENRGGGAEVQAWLLARELARREFTVSYICQSVTGKAGKMETVERVKLQYLPRATWFKWGNAVRIFRCLREEEPDWVVQRMTSLETGVIGLYCRTSAKKFAWICTDNASPCRWKHLKEQIATHRQKVVHPLKRPIFLLQALLADLMRHVGMRWITVPFTQNDQQETILREQFGLDSARIVSGQEPPAVLPTPGDKLNTPIVLWVADLSPIKRPQIFIELARKFIGESMTFIMIGNHPDQEYKEKLFQGCPANLRWLGKLSFDETLSWFDRASLFVSTSVSEGFPNTFIHAWFRGLPVLSLGVDLDGLIQKKGLGLVASSESELADDLCILRANSSLYKMISHRTLEYANYHHTVSIMTDGFLESLGIQPSSHETVLSNQSCAPSVETFQYEHNARK